MPSKSITARIGSVITNQKSRTYFIKSLCFIGLMATTMNISQKHDYTFKVEGITDLAQAKELTDPIRAVFNKGENPYQYYPAFNDETDQFDFTASADISRKELERAIRKQGKALVQFNKRNNKSWSIVLASSVHP